MPQPSTSTASSPASLSTGGCNSISPSHRHPRSHHRQQLSLTSTTDSHMPCSNRTNPIVIIPAHQLPLLTGTIPPESMPYFHGKVTREQAERLLLDRGASEGLYLLRESVSRNFVVSICHMGRVHHYNVERQPDQTYRIQTGRRFMGPVELLQYHSSHLDGFLTLASSPLARPAGLSPLLMQGVHTDEMEQKLRLKAVEMGLKGQSVDEALSGPMRNHLYYLVARDLHVSQPWYHGVIRRREAERRLMEAVSVHDHFQDGAFLVRFRKEDSTFVLTLCSEGEPKHYKIVEHLGRWSIEGGQYFETLIEMIDHYHHRQDGLLCKLRRSVVAPSFTRSRSGADTKCKLDHQPLVRVTSPVIKKIVNNPTAFSTNMTTVSDWNGSHSLPSLCSLALGSNPRGDRDDDRRTKETQPATSDRERKCSDTRDDRISCVDSGNETSKHDLISFAEWPNVTLLLSSQNDHWAGVTSTTATPNSSANTNPFPSTPFTPTNAMPNSLIELAPARNRTGTGPVDSLASDPLPPPLPPLLLTTAAGGRSASVQPTEVKPRRQLVDAGKATGCATAAVRSPVLTAAKLVTSPSHLCPVKVEGSGNLGNGGVITAELNAAVANVILSAFSSVSTAGKTATTTVSTASVNTRSGHVPTPTNSTTHTFPEAHPAATTTTAPPPTQSLHFPPILDSPWEEPECNDDPGPLVETVSGKTNPFLPVSSPTGHLHKAQQQMTHSPDVSTFCSAACCCQAGKGTSSSVGFLSSTGPTSLRSAWAKAACTDNCQTIYDDLPPSNFLLNSDCVQLRERLGGGNFGHVVRGVYRTSTGQEVPVAVKTLKPSQIVNTGERDILAEARTMAQLRHRHIVRLIGVCKDEHFMLILELASLGPINKYLKKHPEVPAYTLTELMHQVAMGMAYLESCKFIHRDLAARNVLLVSPNFVKISDFGMSKALNFGSDYYRAETSGKWPLKWYAPECIYYFKFDSKSDVWSYGITLWEVYSYGERPYRDMKGAQILAMLDQGLRLARPSRCPESIYSIMQQCWNFEGSRRPMFAELVLTLSRILRLMPTLPQPPPTISARSPRTNHNEEFHPRELSPRAPETLAFGTRPHHEHTVGITPLLGGSGGSGVNSSHSGHSSSNHSGTSDGVSF